MSAFAVVVILISGLWLVGALVMSGVVGGHPDFREHADDTDFKLILSIVWPGTALVWGSWRFVKYIEKLAKEKGKAA